MASMTEVFENAIEAVRHLPAERQKEIAEILQKSAGAVRVEAHRAMKKLRDYYERIERTIEKLA